jgi:hypothetical protein
MQPNPFGLAYSLSPVDLPEPLEAAPNPLRWTSQVILAAALTLALLNAHALRGWTYQLPANAWSARAISAAESWYKTVDRVGLNQPVETMRAGWQALKAPRPGAQASPEPPSSRSARA